MRFTKSLRMKRMCDVAIVGAGAAGMMAGGIAALRGLGVTLIERNGRPGRKLMITGKGRCNLTNACGSINEFMRNVPGNGRFLYGALSRFGPDDTMEFFGQKLGVKLKTERGRRVFPESDRAADIVDALKGFALGSGCRIRNGRAVEVVTDGGAAAGVKLENGEIIRSRAVIICTGGMSYPLTGSTGDGYAMARMAGHKVTELRPSLVPLETVEEWPYSLQGLSLKNIKLSALDLEAAPGSHGIIFEELGEMLFTHFGVSGPLVLSASSHMRDMKNGRYKILINLKPGLTHERLDLRLQRDFIKYGARNFINSLGDLLPSGLIPVVAKLSGIPPELKTSQLSREARAGLGAVLKGIELNVKGFRPIEEAVITSGGVDVSEINPKTMESKLVKNLYFAGEIIDCDAYTGGFNLQIAFSTGYTAGVSVLHEA